MCSEDFILKIILPKGLDFSIYNLIYLLMKLHMTAHLSFKSV